LLQPEKAAARAANLAETNEEFLHAAWDAAIEGAKAPIDLSAGGFVDMSSFVESLRQRQFVTVSQFPSDDVAQLNLGLLDIPAFSPAHRRAT
ncbi:MAG: hypothetical protein RL009_1208, partial [Actinomycetota bacterium]